MNSKIKVLVVDDSTVIRRVLSGIIDGDDSMEVIGVAKDGAEAVEKILELEPDVVTLDVEMPKVDGLGALEELRKRQIRLPVVMFSALTERGGRKTLEALSLGASDYVTKPDSAKNLADSSDRIRSVLLPKLRALGDRHRNRLRGPGRPAPARRLGSVPPLGQKPTAEVAETAASPTPTPAPALPKSKPLAMRRPRSGAVDAVMIGVSTGGPNALQELFSELRVDVPIAITQHMPPTFTRLLAERLDGVTPMEVLEAEDGMPMRPGRVIVAPGDFHLEFERRGVEIVCRTTQGPPENSCRPAVDVMLRSALKLYGPSTLSVIMTGMGQDGMLGCEAAYERGARVIAQDEASSVVWGMPGAVHQRGVVDKVVPLSALAGEIMSITRGANARAGRG